MSLTISGRSTWKRKKISESLATGEFVRVAMNKYVIEHRIDYVYSVDDSLMAFVARYWGISEAPYFPSLMPPDLPLALRCEAPYLPRQPRNRRRADVVAAADVGKGFVAGVAALDRLKLLVRG